MSDPHADRPEPVISIVTPSGAVLTALTAAELEVWAPAPGCLERRAWDQLDHLGRLIVAGHYQPPLLNQDAALAAAVAEHHQCHLIVQALGRRWRGQLVQ